MFSSLGCLVIRPVTLSDDSMVSFSAASQVLASTLDASMMPWVMPVPSRSCRNMILPLPRLLNIQP